MLHQAHYWCSYLFIKHTTSGNKLSREEQKYKVKRKLENVFT